MQITSFGCSFTFGEELDDLPDWFNDKSDKRNYMPLKLKYEKASKKSYPYVVGSFLDFEVENNGWRGGSNDRIFRTFFDHLINNKKKTIYTIQWTFPHRTEYWSEKRNMFRGIVPDFNTDFKKQNSKKESIVYSSEYYSKFQNDDVDNKKLLRYIWSVDSLCKQFGHELIQFMPVENKLDMLPESFLNSMEIMTLVENKIHPTEEQHKRLAKYLLIGLTNVLQDRFK